MSKDAPDLNLNSGLLNIGCGNVFHHHWINVDLHPIDPSIIKTNLKDGIPFPDNRFDAVYHAHFMEHINSALAPNFIKECFRVLAPGGIMRVVVPDLENICRAYLESLGNLDNAPPDDEDAIVAHKWMVLELIDQITRIQSGGEMMKLLRNHNLLENDFIRSRLSSDMTDFKNESSHTPDKPIMMILRKFFDSPVWYIKKFIGMIWGKLFYSISLCAYMLMYGKRGKSLLLETRFRSSGELHRWLYDRILLSQILSTCGFRDIEIMTAEKSRIPDFNKYGLDMKGGRQRKPDSIYLEATKY